jgi:hypothetical protein
MLTDFDQNTVAMMTAALEYVCKRIPSDKDSHELRKRIADAMVACGHEGRRTLIDFQEAGEKVLDEVVRPRRFNWFGLGLGSLGLNACDDLSRAPPSPCSSSCSRSMAAGCHEQELSASISRASAFGSLMQ